ncbi:hypothetical protein B0A48_03234 [Cryoendolithus antarcticus]|uniref:DUF7708 domain-containing protein n=1 Tax=Cryoendolithus antarcticus TaxID=1507870 RepID=A0A1V8TJG2_9PEZI|nr:hypothetical protein B0A48_03234 [Cryoendolithus antarcticus]
MSSTTVGSFVANRAASIVRRDSKSDTAWTSAVDSLNAPNPSQAIVQRTSAFKLFLTKFATQTTKPGVNGYHLQPGCSITDVQREANDALAAYEERGNSLRKHFLHTAARDFSRNASAIEILLKFLPDGDYSSVICGALALVFNAAKRIQDIREKILDCLSALTRTVEGTQKMHDLYYGDRELWQAAEDLYIALLDAVESMIAWLDEKAWRRVMGAMFKQANYARPLEEKIKLAVETKAKAFHEHLEYCQHRRIQKIDIGVDRIIRDVADAKQDIARSQADLKQAFAELCNANFQQLQWSLANWSILQSQSLQNFMQQQQAQNKPTPARGPMISVEELLGCLRVADGNSATDLDHAVRYGQSISPGQQARAALLLQNAHFQTWFRSAESAILVVQGRCRSDVRATQSPLTYFTGLFATMLDRSQTAVPLTYIGGKHSTPGDPMEGAEGMMRMLVSQLLLRFGDAIELPDMNYLFIEATKAGDIRYLCELFRSIIIAIVQSASTPVAIVCLLDGLSLLETGGRRSSFESAVRCLQRIVNEASAFSGMLILKIVLLYPHVSQYAWEWFPRSAILTLGDEAGGDGHGYNSARLAAISESAMQGALTPRAHTPVPYQ